MKVIIREEIQLGCVNTTDIYEYDLTKTNLQQLRKFILGEYEWFTSAGIEIDESEIYENGAHIFGGSFSIYYYIRDVKTIESNRIEITEDLIKKMELDPHDDWDCDYDNKTENVGVIGIEQDIRDYCSIQPEVWPDSYVNIYAEIEPIKKIVTAIEFHVITNYDDTYDVSETITVPKEFQKKIFEQLRDSDAELTEEFIEWTKENAEYWK